MVLCGRGFVFAVDSPIALAVSSFQLMELKSLQGCYLSFSTVGTMEPVALEEKCSLSCTGFFVGRVGGFVLVFNNNSILKYFLIESICGEVPH